MATKRLALNTEGHMTYCTAPQDKIGVGRCNHTEHQGPDESIGDFVDRVNLDADRKYGTNEFRIALGVLDSKLSESDSSIEINAIGGFAIMHHGIGNGRVTLDIDTVTKDYAENVNKDIEYVAVELNMPKDWLNNENVLDDDTEIVEMMIDAHWMKADYGLKNIDINIASIDTLINAKIIALDSHNESGRLQDLPDLLDLLDRKGIKSMNELDMIHPNMNVEYPDSYRALNDNLQGKRNLPPEDSIEDFDIDSILQYDCEEFGMEEFF